MENFDVVPTVVIKKIHIDKRITSIENFNVPTEEIRSKEKINLIVKLILYSNLWIILRLSFLLIKLRKLIGHCRDDVIIHFFNCGDKSEIALKIHGKEIR